MNSSLRPKHYKVIYPTRFGRFPPIRERARAYYDCMTLADIKALPVSEWAAAIACCRFGRQTRFSKSVRRNPFPGL